MSTRILFAAVGIPVLLLIALFAPLWLYAVCAGGIAALCAIEFVRCTVPGLKMRFSIYTAVAAFATVFGAYFGKENMITACALYIFVALLFSELILSIHRGEPMKLFAVALLIVGGGVLPILLAGLVRIGIVDSDRAFWLISFIVTFTTDSGAYFVGTFLGKHPLMPNVSPKKTIEGSVGGFLVCILAMLIYGLILKLLGYIVYFPLLLIYAFLGSFVCQLGDLAFSAVKRICGVKDFGKIIPGSGGALDRFDSLHFVAPLMEILILWLPAFIK